MAMQRNSHVQRGAIIIALGLVSFLTACSDLYIDRRETVAFGAGDAVATDKVLQMIDPWPRDSANRNHSTNGQKAAGAIERYRTGHIIQPQGAGTSSSGYGQAPVTISGGAPTSSTTQGSSN
jgi:hypothetical protein